MVGAEFRIGGIPASWQIFPVPQPDMISLGNAFEDGVSAAFTSCPRPETGVVLFYRALVLASELESDLQFTVEKRDPPTNPLLQCPLIVLCDFPFTLICVEGLPCHVNSTSPRTCGIPVAVTTATWSAMKELYR